MLSSHRADARARVIGHGERDDIVGLVEDRAVTDAQGESSRRRDRADKSQVDSPRQLPATLPTAAELFVPSLPGIPNMASHPTHPLTLFAGEIPSYPGEGNGGGEGPTGKDATIFFMMARARRSAGKQRVVFWFNGGPGCSSFDGSLMEVGPFRTVPGTQTESRDTELRLVEGGWEEFATMVFIDQPPGTGLSYVPTNGYLHELDQASAHLIQFLENFYTVFPELDGLDTYLAGESYAGQYIPYFADALIKTTKLPTLNLLGVAIGNGWIDPLRQYPAYAEFGYIKGLIKHGTSDGDALDDAVKVCNEEMEKYLDPLSTPVNIDHCGQVMDRVSDPFQTEMNGRRVCLNIYDVRLVDDWPACGMNWPPDLADVYQFLHRPDVVEALHATMHETGWIECDGKVGAELYNRRSPASVHLIPGIIEAGVKVLMFAGAEDLICNYVGIERMIEAMEWNGEQGFGNATINNWYLNETLVGEWTTSRNMSYAKLFDSSHMVGFDVPHVSNDMIMRFMDVDVSLLPGLTAAGTSRVGDDERLAVHFGAADEDSGGMPLFKGGADWESWYNAVSAVLILATLVSIVGVYLFFRRRTLRRGRLALRGGNSSGGAHRSSMDRDREERVPLAGADEYELGESLPAGNGRARREKGKGKAKAIGDGDIDHADHGGNVVFALGDDDDR